MPGTYRGMEGRREISNTFFIHSGRTTKVPRGLFFVNDNRFVGEIHISFSIKKKEIKKKILKIETSQFLSELVLQFYL